MSIEGKLKDIKRQIKKDPKKFILMILPYMAVAYAFNKISYAYRITDGDEVLPRLMTALRHLRIPYLAYIRKIFLSELLQGLHFSG